jgi:uncharacterized membrane protein
MPAAQDCAVDFELRRSLALPLVIGIACQPVGYLIIRGDAGGLVGAFGFILILITVAAELLLRRRERREGVQPLE